MIQYPMMIIVVSRNAMPSHTTHGPFMAVAHGSLLFSHQVAPAGSAIWGPKGTGRSWTMGLQRDKPTIFMVEQHFHNCNSYLFILAVPSQ